MSSNSGYVMDWIFTEAGVILGILDCASDVATIFTDKDSNYLLQTSEVLCLQHEFVKCESVDQVFQKALDHMLLKNIHCATYCSVISYNKETERYSQILKELHKRMEKPIIDRFRNVLLPTTKLLLICDYWPKCEIQAEAQRWRSKTLQSSDSLPYILFVLKLTKWARDVPISDIMKTKHDKSQGERIYEFLEGLKSNLD